MRGCSDKTPEDTIVFSLLKERKRERDMYTRDVCDYCVIYVWDIHFFAGECNCSNGIDLYYLFLSICAYYLAVRARARISDLSVGSPRDPLINLI